MFHIKNYYNKLYMKGYDGPKRVFVASDGSVDLQKLSKKFPEFSFIDSNCFPYKNTLSNEERTYGPLTIISTLLDVHLLSMCDYLVCTMSSNVCYVKLLCYV